MASFALDFRRVLARATIIGMFDGKGICAPGGGVVEGGTATDTAAIDPCVGGVGGIAFSAKVDEIRR